MSNDLDRPYTADEVLHLYEIATELDAVLCMIDEAEGELTDEAVDALNSWQLAFDKKVERVVHVIRNYKATADAAKAEADRLNRLRRSRQKTVDSLREYLLQQMKRADRLVIETALVKVRVMKASKPSIRWMGTEVLEGSAVAVPAKIPAAFVRIKEELDGDLAQLAYASGDLPEGFTTDFKESVTIR